ncbi:MAG: hypothetical protein AAGE52_30610 [Myxococcota bacterium]
MTELKLGRLSTASARIAAIRTKLREAGAPEDLLATEVARARRLWRAKVPEPESEATSQLEIQTTTEHKSAGYRDARATKSQKTIRMGLSEDGKRDLKRAGLFFLTAPIAAHLASLLGWPVMDLTGLVILDGLVFCLLLLFAWETASGTTIRVGEDSLTVEERYLFRPPKTRRFARREIDHIRVTPPPPRDRQHPRLAQVELVLQDGSVHIVQGYSAEATAKALAVELEETLFDFSSALRVRISEDTEAEPARVADDRIERPVEPSEH